MTSLDPNTPKAKAGGFKFEATLVIEWDPVPKQNLTTSLGNAASSHVCMCLAATWRAEFQNEGGENRIGKQFAVYPNTLLLCMCYFPCSLPQPG